MSLHAYPMQTTQWSLPESVPRQKAYTYLFLIFLTAIFLFFYSYPLDMENWSYTKTLKVPNANFDYLEITAMKNEFYEYDFEIDRIRNKSKSILLKKLLHNGRGFTSERTTFHNTDMTRSEMNLPPAKSSNNSSGSAAESVKVGMRNNSTSTEFSNKVVTKDTKNDFAKTANNTTAIKVSDESEHFRTTANGTAAFRNNSGNTIPEAAEEKNTKTIIAQSVNQNENKINTAFSGETLKSHEKLVTNPNITESKTIRTKPQKETHHILSTGEMKSRAMLTVTKKSELISENDTMMTPSKPPKGFLVFSPHCRIPDIDPWHSSIRHLVEINPPLDCSVDYPALSRTEGHVLILNEESILKRTGNRNYSCCYKSVYRKNDGKSDDSVGFSKECIKISSKAVIDTEFISLKCKYENGTYFYKEFHSFIFDKPKVERRCNKSTGSKYSVLIIGVDAMSRMNMHRQLNGTSAYMLGEMDAVEMYGFNKVGDNTFPNLIPLLVGYDERELTPICWKSSNLPLDRCNFLWKRFAKKGYRTLYAEDSPHISSFNYVKNGFLHQPTDYYFRNFILAYENALGRNKPLNCYECVGSTSETEAVLHWTEQFAQHFSERPYFAFNWINSLTHDYLNKGSTGDHMYARFLRSLHSSGALDRTIVIMMGDHGMRWGEIRRTYIGRLEERLPMLLISLPKAFKEEHPKFAETLRDNSHKLVTPFDLHATLLHLLNLTDDWVLTSEDKLEDDLLSNFTSRALSLFQEIPDGRSCDDAFIEEHWCTCESSLETDIDSDEVKHVANYLLSIVNDLLKPVVDKCAKLTLDFVSDARLWQPPSEHKGHSVDDNIYTVVIHTKPGGAVFEGTVKLSQPGINTKLLGTISRLNLYGNQSSCIDNAVLRKYCYCL